MPIDSGELPVQHIVGYRRGGSLAIIYRAPTAAGTSAQSVTAHEPLDPMQTAHSALGQHVTPDPPRTIRAITRREAGPHTRPQCLIAACPRTRRPGQPGMKPAARDTERLAKPPHRPNPSMLCNEAELHIDSLAK
jgi:hypothetical protein